MRKYVKASEIDLLRDEVDRLYSIAYNMCDENIVEGILLDNGATETDNGEFGFLTGVSEPQLKNMIRELDNLISSVSDDAYYTIKFSDSEIDLIIKALDHLVTPNSKMQAQVKAIRNKLTRY